MQSPDHWHVRRSPWLESLKPALAEEIRRAATVRSYVLGETIFGPTRQPENVWLVEHGLVRIHRMGPDGRQMTLGIVRPGHVFGETPVLNESPRLSFAEAMRRSSCWRIPRETFVRVVRSDPAACFSISKSIAGRIERIESRLEDLAFRSVEDRLIRTLLRLADEFSHPAGEWIEVELSLTQAELATLVGATRQSINESLRSLAERGLLARDRNRLALRASALLEMREAANA